MGSEEVLKIVKENSYVLGHVEEQTKEICLMTVKQTGYALEYVKDKSMLD